MKKDIVKLAVSIVACQMAGFIGSIFTTKSIPTWYASLERPSIAPPNWVFAPVWTTLFVLMGISAFMIWRLGLKRKDVKVALGFFIAQLVLNTLWSVIFFGLRSLGGAFFEIVILWLSILFTIILFFKISRPAAYLLFPYIAWVSFASYLTYSYWALN